MSETIGRLGGVLGSRDGWVRIRDLSTVSVEELPGATRCEPSGGLLHECALAEVPAGRAVVVLDRLGSYRAEVL